MYQQQDFDHLQFNPMDRDLLDNRPELHGLFPPVPPPPKKKKESEEDEDEFQETRIEYEGLKPLIIRYVIALYDPGSPLKRDFPKLPSRQGAAAELVGFDVVAGKDELLRILFNNSDPFFVGLIHNYLKEYAQSMLYAQVQANESVFWEYVRRMMTFSASADDDIMKSKMGDELGKIQDRIEVLTRKFYGDDDRLVKAAENVKKRRTNPEGWAR
jgi:hypothetical protein